MKKSFLDFPPALVVEILFPSTALRDRHTKFETYEQQGIHYCLIVNPEKNTIEVYQLQEKKYAPVTSSDGIYQFEFGEDCPAVINSKDTW
ncbi:MAG: Uma2 family endonuclease [Bacteroidota bacterium]